MADEIRRLQAELGREIEASRKHLGWNIKEKIIDFEQDVVAGHKRLRTGIWRFLVGSSLRVSITAPVIYSLLVPFLLIDAWVSLYQAICFRAYRIPQVRRSDYVIFDRRHLAYLNGIEVVNCLFCGYANGVIGYVREVGSRTEQYWCPIKHALRVIDPPDRYRDFLEYGDAEGYRAKLTDFRTGLREKPPADGPPPA
ncbi:MAG: hypothetical protein P4L98_12230 [Ancalomicrobiaceae bacterium]|nr:hypothetical protein [Ancalomicrobiaceae bacterium]